jgi:hypothetical protein
MKAMENENKVLLICSFCLNAEVKPKLSTDPKGTRFVLLDHCPKCNAEALNPIKYFNAIMKQLKKKQI